MHEVDIIDVFVTKCKINVVLSKAIKWTSDHSYILHHCVTAYCFFLHVHVLLMQLAIGPEHAYIGAGGILARILLHTLKSLLR